MIIWTTEQATPTKKLAAPSSRIELERATSRSATIDVAEVVTMTERRSRPSPSGTSRIIPSA